MDTVVFKEVGTLGLLVKKILDFKDRKKCTMSKTALLNITVFHSWRKMTLMVC